MSKESKIMTAIIAVFAGVLIAVFMLGNKSDPTSSAAVPNADRLTRADSHKTGSGPVTMVEFGDYQCPACSAAQPTVERLQAEYKDKVRFVFRHYPLPQHKNAAAAAEAAEAAAAQGKFWEMTSKLYSAQKEWENLGDPADVFAGYAAGLGMDGGKIKEAIARKQFDSRIQTDISDGNAVSVQGTPTFFVNGIAAKGFSYDVLKGMIDSALAGQ